MEGPPKQYGLITRKKPTPILDAAPVRRLAAFASDSDDDTEAPSRLSTQTKVNIGLGELQKRQIQKAQDAALTADPTIFQYDELYDDLQEKREVEKVQQKPVDKKPKYIERLLKSADTRKKEYERRIERQVQKDREAEGEEFRDKESFVTSSYRAKLEEMRLAEAAEKRDEYLEAIGDVTKQRDLGGFYRHMFEQRLGENKKDALVKSETEELSTARKDDHTISAADKNSKKERTYRKRKNSDTGNQLEDEKDEPKVLQKKESASEETSATKRVHIQSNLDADSDFSIDSSDSESEAENKKKEELDAVAKDDDVFVKPLPMVGPSDTTERSELSADSSSAVEKSASDTKKPIVEPKVKVNIWLKRTVGDVLNAATQRYYERKVARAAQ